jgi:hypothetical protein
VVGFSQVRYIISKLKEIIHPAPYLVFPFAWLVSGPDNIVIYKEEISKHGKMLYELV